MGESLADAVGFSSEAFFQGTHPFVFDDEGLDFLGGELRVAVVGKLVESGLSVLDLLFQVGLLLLKFEPGAENGEWVIGRGLFLCSAVTARVFGDFLAFPAGLSAFFLGLQFLLARGDGDFVDFIEIGEDAILPTVFLFQFGQFGGGGFEVGFQRGQGFLVLGKKAGHDEGPGDEVAGPAFVAFLAFFVFDQDALGFGDPSVGGDEVGVVLHGFSPVIHEVLIDQVFADQGEVRVMGEDVLGDFKDEVLGLKPGGEGAQFPGPAVPPGLEMGGGVVPEGGEFRVFLDGGLDGGRVHGQAGEAFPLGGQEVGAEPGAGLPVGGEGVEVGIGYPAVQVGLDVLPVLGSVAVDVAGDVEIVVVGGNFLQGDEAGEPGEVELLGEGIDDLVHVHAAETVLGAVLEIALAGVDEENAFPLVGSGLVDDNQAGGDAGTVKEVGGQTDDALDKALLNEFAADGRLGVAPEEDPVGENTDAAPGAFEGPDNMQEVGVVPLFGGRDAVVVEAAKGVVLWIEAAAPALVGKGGIGDHVVKGFEGVAVGELGVGNGIARQNHRGRVIVQDHVHVGEAHGGGVLFLPVEGDLAPGLVADLQEEGTGTAGRIVNGGIGGGFGGVDFEYPGDDPANLGGSVELPLALAALGGEIPHEVFVGVAENIVPIGPVAGKVEGLVFENGDEPREAVHHLPSAAELVFIGEVGEFGEHGIRLLQGSDDPLIDLVPDIGLALEGDHVGKTGPLGDLDRGEGFARILVAGILDKEHDQHVILVLARIHASAQLVATGPEVGIKSRFFDRHKEKEEGKGWTNEVEGCVCTNRTKQKQIPLGKKAFSISIG